jgi:hypothetical protein
MLKEKSGYRQGINKRGKVLGLETMQSKSVAVFEREAVINKSTEDEKRVLIHEVGIVQYFH